ncbi:uncharacterized protein [Chironomus tepperi]|uniref:uncharacterized protein n=1 Tax=Chironomus tepperi TaxID=113505 RepID=UPI00391F034B
MEFTRNVITASFKRILKRNIKDGTSGKTNDDNQLSSVATSQPGFDFRSKYQKSSILPRTSTASESSIYLNKDFIKRYTINSCRSFRSALEMFSSPAIKEELEKFRSILLLKFRINGNFYKPNMKELVELNARCKKAAVVILIASKNEDDFLIYWKSREIDRLLKLKSYKENFGKQDKNLCEFTAEFLVESLFQGCLGLKSTFDIQPSTTEIEFNYLADSRDYNLLFIAAEIGNVDVLKTLLLTGLKTSMPDSDLNIQMIAYNNQQFDVLLVLLQENFPYPECIDINLCSEEVQEFHKTSSELHKMIKVNNSSKICEILSKNPDLRYFYNLSNESALAVALASRSLDIYKILVSNKIFFGPHEDVDELLKPLGQRDRRTLREYNYKYLKTMSERHINILMANSLIGSDITDESVAHDVMLHAYRVLNRNPMTKILLEVVASTRNFQIIFEFNRDSVNVLNPTAEKNTKGLYSTSGKIFIAAKELLDSSTENEAFGTLAHELCHYALNAVYENKARPYLIKHKDRFLKFMDICSICEENSVKEQYIDMVFTRYPTDVYHAELIVRVPHLAALYHSQPDKLKTAQENFPELFEYYEKIVMSELENALPKLLEKSELKIGRRKKRYFLRKRFYAVLVIIIGLFVLFGFFYEEAVQVIKKVYLKATRFN